MWRQALNAFVTRRTMATKATASNSHYLIGFMAAGGALTYARESMDDENKPISLARRNSMRKQKKFYPYVIVGAGTTAHAAIEAIRQHEPNAEVLLLSDEASLPRVDSEWRQQDGMVQPIADALMDTYNEWRRHVTCSLSSEPDAYSSSPVTLLLGKKDMHFDVEQKRILLGDGTEVSYEKCLLANAGKPRNFYVLDSNRISYTLRDRINTCTSVSDFEQLDTLLKNENNAKDHIMNVTVVGGGFLGTEIASILATDPRREKKLNVQQVFVESYPLARYLPDYLTKCIQTRLEKAGVQMVSDRLVTGVKAANDGTDNTEEQDIVISLMGDTKEKLSTDYVALCSTHIDPSVTVAKDSCLEIDPKNGGIVVNSHLEAVAGMYVAGNLASYYDTSLGRRRVDMYDNALASGLCAGNNMVASKAGKSKSYVHQPMFRSNLAGIDVLLEGVGKIDSNLKTVGVWLNKDGSASNCEQNPERGIIYYVSGSKLVGIMLWNASDLLESARQVLNNQPDIRNYEDLKQEISIGPDHWLKVVVAEK